MRKNICLFLFLFLFYSCVRIAEIDTNWDNKKLPVVFSLITPGGMAKVILTESCPGINSIDTFPNAEVYMLDENNNQLLLSRLDSVSFADTENKMKIVASKTYRLKIDLKNGSPLINASTTVPNIAADFEKYSILPTSESSEYEKSVYFDCMWKTPAENQPTDDYFLITSWHFGMLQIIRKDKQTYTTGTNQLYYPVDNIEYSIALVTADKWLSRYLFNENMQLLSIEKGTDISVVFLPDFSGVLSGFSNIEGGMGVFGSYQVHIRDLNGNTIK